MINGLIKIYNAVIIEYFIVDSPKLLIFIGMVKFWEDKVLTIKAKWFFFIKIAASWSSKE